MAQIFTLREALGEVEEYIDSVEFEVKQAIDFARGVVDSEEVDELQEALRDIIDSLENALRAIE